MSSKRQNIISTAFKLFSQNGFYATGIDQIILESNTSKKTLYTHFKSKNDLVEAILYHYKNQFKRDMDQELQNIDKPEERLSHFFNVAYGWYNSKKFNGCLAISAMNEYGNKNSAIEKACRSFKAAEHYFLEMILRDMGIINQNKTNNLMIVLEGITATAHIGEIQPSQEEIQRLITTIINN